MKRSKNLKEFAVNIAEIYQSQPAELDGYLKSHNVCFRVGVNPEQFYNDLQLCISAGRTDLIEYIIGRDIHLAFALWALFRKPVDLVTEFFSKPSTQAAITLAVLNSMK